MSVAGGPITGGSVPVIEVAEDLGVSVNALMAIGDPVVRRAALVQFMEKLPAARWPALWEELEETMGAFFFGDSVSFAASVSMTESALHFMMLRDPEAILDRTPETGDGQEPNDGSGRDNDAAAYVLQLWAGHDLPAAMAYFEKNLSTLSPNMRAEAAEGLAREFVKKDPAAAFAWIKSLPPESQDKATQAAFQTLSRTDLEAARRYLVTETELPNRDECATKMASVWAATSPEEALAWAKELPEELSSRAVQAAIEPMARDDFAAALGAASALPAVQQDAALSALARALADGVPGDQSHLPGVLRLVEETPEGPGRAAAARSAILKWTEADPEAASAWVAVQQDGPSRDAAIQGFGSAVVASRHDPEAGLEWISVMSNPADRKSALELNVREWAGFDPTSARAWVQSAPRLSDGDRETLLPLTRN